MRHQRRLPVRDIAIFLLTLLLSALLLVKSDIIEHPDRSDGMPNWCQYHDEYCTMISKDPVGSLR